MVKFLEFCVINYTVIFQPTLSLCFGMYSPCWVQGGLFITFFPGLITAPLPTRVRVSSNTAQASRVQQPQSWGALCATNVLWSFQLQNMAPRSRSNSSAVHVARG